MKNHPVPHNVEKTVIAACWLRSIPVLVLCIALAVSLLMWWMLDQSFRQKALTHYHNETEDITWRFIKRLQAHEQVLMGGLGLFYATDKVTRENWRRYLSSSQLYLSNSGILGIGYCAVLTPAEKKANVQAIRAEGFPEYNIRPEGERPIYTSIVYLEPFNWRNQRAFGYDMYTESIRRAAMDEARDTGKTTITAKIILVQETEKDKQSGMLMFVPVYRVGFPIDSVENRRKALQGFVYSPIRMNDFIRGTLMELPKEIAFEIYSGASPTSDSLMFSSIQAEMKSTPNHFTPNYEHNTTVESYGNTWCIAFKTMPGFAKLLEKEKSYSVLGLSIVMSFLLSAFIRLLLKTRENALILAEQMTRELRVSEDQFRSISTAAQDAVILMNEEGLISFWNDSAVRMFGYSAEEAIGQDMHELIAPQSFHKILENKLIDFWETGQGSFIGRLIELRAIRKDGVEFPVELSLASFCQGAHWNAVGFLRDITVRKQTEEALAQASKRLFLATKAGGVGVWDYDVVQNTLTWDDQMFELYGIPKESSAPINYETWKGRLHPDDADRGNQEIQMALSGEKDFDTEFSVRWPNGTVRNIRALAVVQRDVAGCPTRIIGTNWDITESKRNAEELANAKKKAEAASNSKSEFLATMSHEIRTPMSGVFGFAELLLKTNLDSRQREFTEGIAQSATALLYVIDDVLDFSKIEAGKLSIVTEEFCLRSVLDAVLEVVSSRSQEKQINVSGIIHHDVPAKVKGDSLRLRQVLLNLVGNAVKFTEKGEVTVRIQSLPSSWDRLVLRFEVKDTGSGLSEEQIRLLFQPYVQAEKSSSRLLVGTGLGLTISSRLVELMEGRIGVLSEPGCGSTFWFELPLMKSVQPIVQESHPSLLRVQAVLGIQHAGLEESLLEQFRTWGVRCSAANSMGDLNREIELAVSQNRTPFVVCEDDFFTESEAGKRENLAKVSSLLLANPGSTLAQKDDEFIGFRTVLIKPAKQSLLFDALMEAIDGKSVLSTDRIESASQLDPDPKGKARNQFSNCRILLAEDHPINRRLCLLMLKELGTTVDTVENGLQLLEALAKHDYDMILMDCNMPEMNGYEATKKIRQLENAQGMGKRIPIVALTANALIGERERCLSAGMDDFITKPFSSRGLDEAIRRHMTGKGADPLVKLSIPRLDDLVATIDPKSVALMVEDYIKEVPRRMVDLNQFLETGNQKELERGAHSLLGISATFGLDELSMGFRLIEAAAKIGDLEKVRDILEAMETTAKAAMITLRQWLDGLPL